MKSKCSVLVVRFLLNPHPLPGGPRSQFNAGCKHLLGTQEEPSSGHEGGDCSPQAGQAGTEGPDTQLQGVWLSWRNTMPGGLGGRVSLSSRAWGQRSGQGPWRRTQFDWT